MPIERRQGHTTRKGNARDAAYEVVYPLGEFAGGERSVAPPLDTLNGKTVGELSIQDWKGDIIFSEKFDGIEKLLPEEYQGIKLVRPTDFGYTYGLQEKETIKALPVNLSKHGCDAVISVLGT